MLRRIRRNAYQLRHISRRGVFVCTIKLISRTDDDVDRSRTGKAGGVLNGVEEGRVLRAKCITWRGYCLQAYRKSENLLCIQDY